MGAFSFKTDAKSEAYCREIAATMMQLFGITESEAIGRINQQFQGVEWVGEDDPGYHELPEDWARIIYYEDYWWMAEHPKPKPFPK